MFEVQDLGVQNFMGMEIPVVEGGFGEGKRCLTDKTIAEIHGMRMFNIRKRVNDNIKRFKEGVDIIDLKRICEINTLTSLGYAKQSITQAEHIYLLSERGYAKLIKIMDTDLAWEIHDKLMDEYFTMRQQIKQQGLSVEQITQIATVAAQAVIAPIMDRFEKLIATKESPKVKAPDEKTPYTITPIAEPFGIKPANANKILAKNGIISKGDKGGWILNEKYEEAGWGITCNAGQHNGPFVRYTKKGKQATTKILSRSSNQEQIKLF